MQLNVDDAQLTARSALLYHLYAEAVDTADLSALRALATDDIRITRGGRSEPGGIESFLDIYRAHVERGFAVCQHAVTNVIAQRDGSVIRTRAYFQARLFHEDRGLQVLIGRYGDDHVVVDGGLKICHKSIQVDRMLTTPVDDTVFAYAGTD